MAVDLTHRMNVPKSELLTFPVEMGVMLKIYTYQNANNEEERIATDDTDIERYSWIFQWTGEYVFVSQVLELPNYVNVGLEYPTDNMNVIARSQVGNVTVETSSGTFTYGGLSNTLILQMESKHAGDDYHSGGAPATVRVISKTIFDNLKMEGVKTTPYTIIEEPIGFDDLTMQMQRHEYHGMGAEMSLGNLEFYGVAFDIIKNKYEENIDEELIYEVLGDGNSIFKGIVDLTTCNFLRSDYKSVKTKVGEIGSKTTFNNRTDKEIDIDDPKTIDGANVDVPTWKSLAIPTKHLLYTNGVRCSVDDTNWISQAEGEMQPFTNRISIYPYDGNPSHRIYPSFMIVPVKQNKVNEFDHYEENERPIVETNIGNHPQYYPNEDHESIYGLNTKAYFESKYIIEFFIHPSYYQVTEGGEFDRHLSNFHFYVRLIALQIKDGSITRSIAGEFVRVDVPNETAYREIQINLSGELKADESITYYLAFTKDTGYPYQVNIGYKIKRATFVKIKMYDNIVAKASNTNMLLVHDALNVISQAISENALSVKSDWYQTPESHWNPGIIGGGALKALTNGYKIRELFSNEDNKRNMPISFKDMIESLSALDCIGWGFSKENDETFVRVERWDWFYKDDVILTLDSANELQVDVEPDRIPTELKIGYKKYATQDQYNSIDSPHGTRTFINGIKALNKKITKESEFIADNYAIEETRRARTQVSETEETTYDENIFVFELVKTDDEYSIGHTSVNPEKVGNPDEFINAKLTPRHMASRWQDYIFATNNSTPFRFTTGEINYQAVFAVLPEETEADNVTTYSLRPFVEDPSVPQAENADIANEHAKFKAEKITFSYPITIDQYRSIIANPYGLIRLTEGNVIVAEGWIMDFKYKFEDGTADFTLIAKYNN